LFNFIYVGCSIVGIDCVCGGGRKDGGGEGRISTPLPYTPSRRDAWYMR